MAAQFARLRPWRVANVAGTLFGAAIASYALISSPQLSQALGAVTRAVDFPCGSHARIFLVVRRIAVPRRPAMAVALRNAVRAVAPCLHSAAGNRRARDRRHARPSGDGRDPVAACLSIAVREFQQDLMDSRRRFRLAVALVLPATGLAIAAAETYALFRPLPGWIGLLQASALLALAGPFALWLTAIKPDIMAQAGAPDSAPETLSAAEAIELERLQAAIAAGVCLEAGSFAWDACRKAQASRASAAPSHQQGARLQKFRSIPERSSGVAGQAHPCRPGELPRADRRGRLRSRLCVPCPVQPGVPPADRDDAFGISRAGARQGRRFPKFLIDSRNLRPISGNGRRLSSTLRIVRPALLRERGLRCSKNATLLDFAVRVYPAILQQDLFRYLIGAGGTFLVVNVLLARFLPRRKIRAERPARRRWPRRFWPRSEPY